MAERAQAPGRSARSRCALGADAHHSWQTKWLVEYPWLRTTPDGSKEDWDAKPNQAPENVYCICCVEFPSVAHKDVVQRRGRRPSAATSFESTRTTSMGVR